VISGTSHRFASGLLFILAALSILGTGCSSSLDGLNSPRYPVKLRYPPRQDLLIKDGLTQELRQLPAPGTLDESIRKASEPTTVTKFDPQDLTKDDRNEIRLALNEIFGSPANPSIEPLGPDELRKNASDAEVEVATENRTLYNKYRNAALLDNELKPDDIDALKVEVGDLRKGSTYYRRHCMHCHGLNGDGRGPTGPWVNPHPRDYRQGKFKFISTNLAARGRKPRRADLHRTVSKGIDGTSMPAFGLLSEKDIDAMVSYVIHLSIRGQVEYDTIAKLLESKDKETGKIDKGTLEGQSIRTHVYNRAAVVLTEWADSNKREAIKPLAYPYEGADEKTIEAAVRNGYQVFITEEKGGCVSCHTDFGRQSPYKYDAWGTLVQARNLTAGNYRGGRRPLDLYWRIAGGIDPSGMKATSRLDAKDTWDLIHFVQALPYPKMLPDDVRKKVYGDSSKGSDSRASR
jgi:mono/diheme cytochrome c family protein